MITASLSRRIAFSFLLVTLAAMNGCGPIGFAAYALSDQSVPAVYELPKRPTVILVDDPDQFLGYSQISVNIATGIGIELVDNKALTAVVDQRKVNDLRQGLGRAFDKQPVDVIGRDVGAQQVIHVHVRSVNYSAQPGMVQPKAVVLIKVIDVPSRKRLFPPSDNNEVTSTLPTLKGGYVLNVDLKERLHDSINSDEQLKVLQRLLASQVGNKVAQVFYKHEPEPSNLRRP